MEAMFWEDGVHFWQTTPRPTELMTSIGQVSPKGRKHGIQNQEVVAGVAPHIIVHSDPLAYFVFSYPQNSGPFRVKGSLLGDIAMLLLNYRLWLLSGQEKESPSWQGLIEKRKRWGC